MRNILRAVVVAVVAAGAVAVAAGTASAEVIGDESAICDTSSIIQTDDRVDLKSRPSASADTIGSSYEGGRYTCSSVEAGGEHDACGSHDSPSWIVIDIYYDDADNHVTAFAPSSCFRDVYAS